MWRHMVLLDWEEDPRVWSPDGVKNLSCLDLIGPRHFVAKLDHGKHEEKTMYIKPGQVSDGRKPISLSEIKKTT